MRGTGVGLVGLVPSPSAAPESTETVMHKAANDQFVAYVACLATTCISEADVNIQIISP